MTRMLHVGRGHRLYPKCVAMGIDKLDFKRRAIAVDFDNRALLTAHQTAGRAIAEEDHYLKKLGYPALHGSEGKM